MKFFAILFSLAALVIPGRSADRPMTAFAAEYNTFLNTWPDAAKSSDYFDYRFMCSTQVDGGAVPTLLINTNPKICIISHNEDHFRYTLVPGRENNVIDVNALPARVKNNFLTWRKNPTVQELCDDINDQLMGVYDLPQMGVASMINNYYPNVSKWILNNIDPIATAIHNGDDYLQKEIRDGSHTYITFSNAHNDVMISPALPIHAVVAAGMIWYRPSAVIVDDVPPAPTPVVHVGKKSAYRIYDPENFSVPIKECVTYLNTMGANDYSWKWFADYYDSNLMDRSSSEYCITRSLMKDGRYSYAIKTGCENYVIDGVTSSWARDDFFYWTSRPTVQELVDYINDSGNDFCLRQGDGKNIPGADAPSVFGEDAAVIKARYAGSPNADDMFKIADNILQDQLILSLAAIPGCEYKRPYTGQQFINSTKVVQVRSRQPSMQPSKQP